ncbi:MAG: hypothetical protein QOD74_187 [Variibacter sp.]|nr:hypothetical protein [Variibacter sp.]
MADIFREVDEEVRRERLKQLWDTWGNYITALMLLMVVGIGGWRAYQWWESKRAAEAGAAFEQAVSLAAQDKSAEAQAAFAKIATEGTSGYRTLARLREAAMAARTDPPTAIREYDSIANDSGVATGLRDIARLRSGMLLVDTGTHEDIRTRVEQLTSAENPFRHSARELMALAAWRAGDSAGARRWIEMIIGDPQSPASTRSRVEMLTALAGPEAKG